MPRALSSKQFWSLKFTELTIKACNVYLGPEFCSISLSLSMSTCMCVHTHIHTCNYTHSTHMHTCVPTCTRHTLTLSPLPAHGSLSIHLHILLFSWSFYPSLENPRHILPLFKTHSFLGGSFPVPSVWVGPTFFKATLLRLQGGPRHLGPSSVSSPVAS